MPTIAARSAKSFTSAGCYGNAREGKLGLDRERDRPRGRGCVAEVLGVAERQHSTVAEHDPVAATGVRSGEGDRGGRAGAGPGAGQRTVVRRMTEREHPAVGADQPVAAAGGGTHS